MAEEREAEARRIGQLIAELRDGQGWSQEELAHELDVSVSTLSRWERGLNKGLGKNIRRLAELLGVEPSVLRPGEPEVQSQLDRIEAEVIRQGDILDRLFGAVQTELELSAAQDAERARRISDDTPGRAGRRSSA